jgi:hypothetical protein
MAALHGVAKSLAESKARPKSRSVASRSTWRTSSTSRRGVITPTSTARATRTS